MKTKNSYKLSIYLPILFSFFFCTNIYSSSTIHLNINTINYKGIVDKSNPKKFNSISKQADANDLLLAAALHGNFKDIKKAMAQGANVNCKNNNNDTPLNMVAKLSYYNLVKYLIEKGAEVNTVNNDKITPLHWGVEYNNVKIVQLLLENDANIDARDSLYETPLHWAGWTGNYESARLLLKYGANPYSKNNTGVTPLELSIRQEHKKVERLFNKKKYKKFLIE